MDNRIFEDFMSQSYRMFYRYCQHTRGQTPEDADEIVSEAFARLYRIWEERQGYDERLNKKWMYNAMDYIILEYSRARQMRPTEPLDAYCEQLSDPAQIDDDLNYRDYVAGIERELGDADRELFRLLYIDHTAYSDARARLNISDGALRTRISRLRDRLAVILKRKK
ncbi:MAG: sigma-70 family RNA polymerase sigma factor [Clostridia bacterium]|nr:sigma-70 family RNA polymerase sigma factor [Clostridia bacterium]